MFASASRANGNVADATKASTTGAPGRARPSNSTQLVRLATPAPVRQPALKVGAPDDAYEREADAVADTVMRMSSPPPPIQRKCALCGDEDKTNPPAKSLPDEDEFAGTQAAANGGAAAPDTGGAADEEKEPIQRKAATDAPIGPAAIPAAGKMIPGSGRRLDAAARNFMEPRFGRDLGHVRIHADAAAGRSAAAINARAYTLGHNIVFGAGEYDPVSDGGRRLLAHELTHVIQQGAAPGASDAAIQRLPTTAMSAPMIQRVPATSVAGGAPAGPDCALLACDWGCTDAESITETVAAVKAGNVWKADPTSLVGNYSKQTRLLPTESEVTGPGGNTTAATACAQAEELHALGHCAGKWYMLSAVNAHENVHVTHLLPTLTAAAPTIQADFNAVTVPDAAGKDAATALTELKALPAYTTAKNGMLGRWRPSFRTVAAGDHSGAAAAAEHGVVDPMVNRICTAIKSNSWPACATCPP